MWTLKVVKGAELADQLQAQVQLPQPLQRFTIGRDPSNHWTIADRTLAISGRHCEIVGTPAGPALRDLSTNGTFVNGGTARLAGEHLLRDGDRIELGPFDIAVVGPPMPTRPAVAAAPAASAVAPPAARAPDAAPQRGGDPAAMLAMGVEHGTVGLTEILRAAPPADDSGVDMTRIRVAPPPPARTAPSAVSSAPAAAPVAAAHAAVTAPAAAEAVTPSSLRDALARGLGVPPGALEGQTLLPLVEQLAAAARAAQRALRGVAPAPGDPPAR